MSYYNGSSYTFTWTGRQLTTAVKGSNTMSFTYNDDGIRTSKTVNGETTTYYLNNSQIVAEETSTHIIVYIYDANGAPIGMQYRLHTAAENEWEVYWFEKNLQGDIVAVYNSDGNKCASYKYDAWGNCSTVNYGSYHTTAVTLNPFRYRGYYYDKDFGMYYLQSRYYDAKMCRFINADGYVSTGQGLTGNNMFAYCGNNPVNYVDYSGEFAIPFAIPAECIILLGLLAVGMTALIADAAGEQVIGNLFVDIVTQTADAINDIANLFEVDTAKDDANDVIITPPQKEVYFPVNPYEFNPVGLTRVEHTGTKNGKIICWMDSTNTEVFRWDQNPNFPDGPHYHIKYDPTHYYPSQNAKVPEPYATIYFPLR